MCKGRQGPDPEEDLNRPAQPLLKERSPSKQRTLRSTQAGQMLRHCIYWRGHLLRDTAVCRLLLQRFTQQRFACCRACRFWYWGTAIDSRGSCHCRAWAEQPGFGRVLGAPRASSPAAARAGAPCQLCLWETPYPEAPFPVILAWLFCHSHPEKPGVTAQGVTLSHIRPQA